MMEQDFTTFSTRSGRPIRLRSLLAGDAGHLIDLFEHLSPTSRYSRFHQTMDHLSDERVRHEADQIAAAVEGTAFGLIAFSTTDDALEVPVAVARFVELSEQEVEVAISVRDDMQGQGIGTEMMGRLAGEARRRGYERLVATILNGNAAVWNIFSRLPYPVQRTSSGQTADIVVDLQGGSTPIAGPQTKVNSSIPTELLRFST